MNLKELKQQFIESIGSIYELDECTAIFDIASDKLLTINKLRYQQLQSLEVDPVLVNQFLKVAEDLATGKPIQYILGETMFYRCKFYVNQNVLIPRPETEELVHTIIQTIRSSPEKFIKVLDIGTGSGCIPIILKKHFSSIDVEAMDVSEPALDVAKRNADLNGVEINFIHADILNYSSEDVYDIIVSNPPYIKEDEKSLMHQNVLAHEPYLALFVSNENPLIFYKAIAAFSQSNLAANGFLFFEINEYLGQDVDQLLREMGFRNIQILKDMQGKDRMVTCQYH